MNRIDVVKSVMRKNRTYTYLEIGVSKGHTFLSVGARRKIGVDPRNQLKLRDVFSQKGEWPLKFWKLWSLAKQSLKLEKSFFFEMTSDDFFYRIPHVFSEYKIDTVLIDGLHTYQQAVRDVLNCCKYLSPHGVIIMHDCNPQTYAEAVPAESIEQAAALNVPGWDWLWCGDVWKSIVYLRSQIHDLNAFVLDADRGLGIVTKGKPETVLSYTQEAIEKMDYKDLEKNRAELLNLKPVSCFYDFITQLKSKQRSA